MWVVDGGLYPSLMRRWTQRDITAGHSRTRWKFVSFSSVSQCRHNGDSTIVFEWRKLCKGYLVRGAAVVLAIALSNLGNGVKSKERDFACPIFHQLGFCSVL